MSSPKWFHTNERKSGKVFWVRVPNNRSIETLETLDMLSVFDADNRYVPPARLTKDEFEKRFNRPVRFI